MKKHLPNQPINKSQKNQLDTIKEAPFEVAITARLLLDEICYRWNKEQLQKAINEALDSGDYAAFIELSEKYRSYAWD